MGQGWFIAWRTANQIGEARLASHRAEMKLATIAPSSTIVPVPLGVNQPVNNRRVSRPSVSRSMNF
jgi:hypothetical protein